MDVVLQSLHLPLHVVHVHVHREKYELGVFFRDRFGILDVVDVLLNIPIMFDFGVIVVVALEGIHFWVLHPDIDFLGSVVLD